mgnify:CR=1 FL=1
MIRTLLIDDEQPARERLKQLLNSPPQRLARSSKGVPMRSCFEARR